MIEVSNSDALHERRKLLRKSSDSFGFDYVKYCPREGSDSQNRGKLLRVVFLGHIPQWLKDNPDKSLLLTRVGSSKPIKLGVPEPLPRLAANEVVITFEDDLSINCTYQMTVKAPPRTGSPDIQQQAAVAKPIETPTPTITPTIDPFFCTTTFRLEHHEPAQADCNDTPSKAGDCDSRACRPDSTNTPVDINYLAKDYATFRQVILDRLSVTLPDWQERCPADIGIMMVEILAYAADHLSYYQDAVATEAYLGTARLRASLRRHARLVDYRVSEGCNARAWVHLKVGSRKVQINPQDLFFVTLPRSNRNQAEQRLPARLLNDALARNPGCQVFEPVVSKSFQFYRSHNSIAVHDWSGATRCLECGATSAYLVNRCPENAKDQVQQKTPIATPDELRDRPRPDDWLQLRVGDVLVLEELVSPWTGSRADADPTHRHPVRITRVEYGHVDRLAAGSLPLVKVDWSREDALPFPLWITKPLQAQWPDDADQAVAKQAAKANTTEFQSPGLMHCLGNMLLVDHGRKIRDQVNLELSWQVPAGVGMQHYPQPRVVGELAVPNLTFACPLPPSRASAAAQLKSNAKQAVPQVVLHHKQLAPASLLDLYSIHELQDATRLAKRLFKQVLEQVNLEEADGEAPEQPTCSLTASEVHFWRGAIRVLVLLQKCEEFSTSRESMLNVGKLRNAVRLALKNLWMAVPDLLDSDSDDARFVVEMSDERMAHLRFGQRGFGRGPELLKNPNENEMVSLYRVGNGSIGNVAAESIQWFGSYHEAPPHIVSVRNPLPASGGCDPESAKEVRLFAPQAIRSELRRAIIPADYDQIVMREFGGDLQAVRTTFRWTGHEMAVMVAIDPLGDCLPPKLIERITSSLNKVKRIGHSVRVVLARRVVPALKLRVVLPAHALRSQVEQSLNELFSSRVMNDGKLGYFHPDRSTFGDGIHISELVSAACQHLGKRVLSVEVVNLHRRDLGASQELEDGLLRLHPQEIVRFDNNPRLLRFGKLGIEMVGGH
jgi:hypothetical protein